ncbi:MAG TPA: hypothetical protein VLM79_23555 [Kofleriaceae bacterium]|nr:hypothetical protein [Kofleriaceae bacterium]
MTARRCAAAAAAAIAGLASGCTLITDSFLTNEFSGDPFPVKVDGASGALVVGVRQSNEDKDRVAVLDLLSPFTVSVIENHPGDARFDPKVSFVDLTLLGERAAGGLDLPRARFREAQVLSVHPCENACSPDDAGCDPQVCRIGPPEAPRPFEAIVGADVLAGDAVRLRLGDDQLFVLADIGGSDRSRSFACDAVFDSPYRGGGTLVISGTELPFGNRRITLQACLGPIPDRALSQDQRGADALLVVSTGIGISILGETAYERYRGAHLAAKPPVPPVLALPESAVYLPSGLVTGRLAKIDALALVAATSSNALAPCRQVYAHHLLTLQNCDPDHEIDDCPCPPNSDFCAVPAVLELTPELGIDFLVVSDDNQTLQALRTELRPDQPEVDGLLGTNALRAVEIDVDYPHDRLLGRCAQDRCSARPQLAELGDRKQVMGCLAGQPMPTTRR